MPFLLTVFNPVLLVHVYFRSLSQIILVFSMPHLRLATLIYSDCSLLCGLLATPDSCHDDSGPLPAHYYWWSGGPSLCVSLCTFHNDSVLINDVRMFGLRQTRQPIPVCWLCRAAKTPSQTRSLANITLQMSVLYLWRHLVWTGCDCAHRAMARWGYIEY